MEDRRVGARQIARDDVIDAHGCPGMIGCFLDQLDPPMAVDLVLRTPEQLRQRLSANDFFLREIVEKGTVLYETADARMG